MATTTTRMIWATHPSPHYRTEYELDLERGGQVEIYECRTSPPVILDWHDLDRLAEFVRVGYLQRCRECGMLDIAVRGKGDETIWRQPNGEWLCIDCID